MRYKLIRFCTSNYFLLFKWKSDQIYEKRNLNKVCQVAQFFLATLYS